MARFTEGSEAPSGGRESNLVRQTPAGSRGCCNGVCVGGQAHKIKTTGVGAALLDGPSLHSRIGAYHRFYRRSLASLTLRLRPSAV